MERLVYTRCSPSIDIVQQGKILNSEGYGVAAISKNFFANTSGANYRLLNKMVCEDKGEVKILDKFYEYACVGDNLYFLSATGHLPMCNEPRPSGKGHRPIFMADVLVGDFKVAPAFLCLKENFKADEVSQCQYYRMDYGVGEKPFELDSIDEASLKQSAEKEGINLKSCKTLIAFILHNLSLPVEKQESIIINDSNENVIKMLRVASSALPLKVMKKVTFLTHVVSMKNNVERYVYYTLQGQEIGEYNTIDEEIKPFRRVKYMVVGFSGMLPRNQASEYQIINSNGDSSFNGAIPQYVNDIVENNPTAKEFRNYIETKLGGEFSKDVDNVYALYKEVNGINNVNNHSELARIASEFANSIFKAEEGFVNLVKNAIANKYQGIALQDALSDFRLLKLVKAMDVALSSKLLTICYQQITKGFDVTPVDLNCVKAYMALKANNYASQEVEADMVAKHIKTSGLDSIMNADETLVAAYYDLYKKTKTPIGEAEKRLISKMIMRFMSTSGKMHDELINLLNANPAVKEELLVSAINNAVGEGNTSLVEALFRLYKPEVSKEDIKFEVARLAKAKVPFSKYEKEYADEVKANPGKVDEIFKNMLKMLEIYPESANNPMDGLRFILAYLESFKASEPNAPVEKALDITLKIIEFKKINEDQSLRTIIAKFESKSLMYALHNQNNRPSVEKLDKIGATSMAKYIQMENKVLKATSGKAQIEALNEFATVRVDIKPEYLDLSSLNALIKSLIYDNAPVHAAFFECFQNVDNVNGYLDKYLGILMSVKNFDKIKLFHSLILSTLTKTNNDKTQKMLKALEAKINQEESDLMKACFDKKYEKLVDQFPQNTEEEKKALEILKEKYKTWDNNHKGFFAKLFGKK